ALFDAASHLLFHSAKTYGIAVDYGTSGCIEIGPYGLAFYHGAGNGHGLLSAANEGVSSNSVVFGCFASPPCTYALASTSENFPGGGGSDTVAVITNPGGTGSSCPWTATSNASWITITSGPGGKGNASVSFTVAANTGAARQGTMTIAGLTFTV